MSGRGMIAHGSDRVPEECARGCSWCNANRAGYCGPLSPFERAEIAMADGARR